LLVIIVTNLDTNLQNKKLLIIKINTKITIYLFVSKI